MGMTQFLMDDDGGGWTVTGLLNGTTASLGNWLGLLGTLIGIVMVIVALFKIAKGLMSKGQGQVNWVQNIVLFVVGCMLAFAGLASSNVLENFGKGAKETLNELGNGGTVEAIVVDVEDLGIETSFTM